jgi:hypothetical protein
MNAYRAIAVLPNVLDQFFEELALRTGWVFTILAGGPEPINGGKIRTLGYVILTMVEVSYVNLPDLGMTAAKTMRAFLLERPTLLSKLAS